MEREIRLARDFSRQIAALQAERREAQTELGEAHMRGNQWAERARALEAENARLRTALANIAGVAAGRSADPSLPEEARDSFTWIDSRAWTALEHTDGD